MSAGHGTTVRLLLYQMQAEENDLSTTKFGSGGDVTTDVS